MGFYLCFKKLWDVEEKGEGRDRDRVDHHLAEGGHARVQVPVAMGPTNCNVPENRY